MLEALRARTPLLVAALYLLVSLPLLTRHGVTYDAPALYYAGDRTLFFLTHPGVNGALDFSKREEPAGFHSFFSREDEWEDPMRYPVFPALVAAVVSAVFHDWSGLLDPAAAHHLGLLLLNTLGLGFFTHYATRFLGRRAGVLAAVALMLFPSAFGHAFNNPKDWPSAMFYGVAVLAAGDGLMSGRARSVLSAGVFVGLSLAAKLNGVFIVITLVLWAPVLYLGRLRNVSEAERRRLLSACLFAPCVTGFVFLISWPWIWNTTAAGLIERVSRYLSFMAAYGLSARDSWTWHPLKCLLFMSPPVILIAALMGIWSWLRTRDRDTRLRLTLIVSWLAVPFLRSMMPRSNFYDANRHFIEYIPALCALAGWGFSQLLENLERLVRARTDVVRFPSSIGVARSVVCAGAAVSLLFPLLRYAPFETAYFNFMVGGLGGAQARALFHMPPPTDSRSDGTEGDYWFQSLRVALIEAGRRTLGPADIALCNAPVVLAQANLTGQHLRPVLFSTAEGRAAPLVWVSPREGACGWRQVRALESERPVLLRVERGGGLIYELLGPRSERRLDPVSAANAYTGGA